MLDVDNARGVPLMVRFLGLTLSAMKAHAVEKEKKMMMAGGKTTSGGEDGDVVVVDWRTSFAEFISEEEEEEDNEQDSTNRIIRWSEERSVRENLQLWFGSPLPSPLSESTDNEKSDFLVECGICYTHRLPIEDDDTDGATTTTTEKEGPLPEAKCTGTNCNRHYHESCLFEWLHSLPTARVSFDRIFGTCPYCCEGISVKVMNGSS